MQLYRKHGIHGVDISRGAALIHYTQGIIEKDIDRWVNIHPIYISKVPMRVMLDMLNFIA
jgi:hypothetical protein